jgi:hypothetical protein
MLREGPNLRGLIDYLDMLNKRDGGINGVKLTRRSARPVRTTVASSATSG